MGAQPVPRKGLTLYTWGDQVATSSSFFAQCRIVWVCPHSRGKGGSQRGSFTPQFLGCDRDNGVTERIDQIESLRINGIVCRDSPMRELSENIRKSGKTAQLNVNIHFANFLLTIPFKAVTRVQIPLGTRVIIPSAS
jgi:hypothetical protein